MDPVNRRIATETLLKFATEKPDLQFVLLTPQDLAAVDDARKQVAAKAPDAMGPAFLKMVAIQPARQNAMQA
jgi:hypothetical protein